MQNDYAKLEIESIHFTSASLRLIQQTVCDALCQYLDQHDPHDHELRSGKVSGLLDVLEQFELSQVTDGRGVVHSLASIRSRVDRFLELLSKAPLANQETLSAFLGTLDRARIKPSLHNTSLYVWDLWELRALAAGVQPDLAEMGRGALRRQHFCENPILQIKPDLLLNMVVQTPFEAEAIFMRLLVHSSMNESVKFDVSPRIRNNYN